MPCIYYIKYWDGTDESAPFKLEFFFSEDHAKERRDEILKRISNAAGKDKIDIFYEGDYCHFHYRDCLQLIDRLNEINQIYST